MKKHRNPQASLSNKPTPDNFSPADALERLYSELVEVEALAHAAGEAVTLLPSASGKHRRTFSRLYTLVSRTADEANAALTLSESLVSALTAYMAAQRATHALELASR
jgi:hypothetical protein